MSFLVQREEPFSTDHLPSFSQGRIFSLKIQGAQGWLCRKFNSNNKTFFINPGDPACTWWSPNKLFSRKMLNKWREQYLILNCMSYCFLSSSDNPLLNEDRMVNLCAVAVTTFKHIFMKIAISVSTVIRIVSDFIPILLPKEIHKYSAEESIQQQTPSTGPYGKSSYKEGNIVPVHKNETVCKICPNFTLV